MKKHLIILVAVLLFVSALQAATVTHRVSTSSTLNVSSYASASFTPAAGDLLVLSVVATGTVDTNPNVTDSQNLGWDFVGSAVKASSVDTTYFFVANHFAAAVSMTVTFNCPNDAATGAIINVSSVSSMTRTGLDAIKQFKAVNNVAAGTPALTFTSSVLTGNPTILVVGNATSPATLTPPTSWTEQSDTGYSTPTTGAEYVSRDSGFTGTAVTWASSSATAFDVFGVEMDTSAYPSAGANDPVIAHVLASVSNKDGETANGIQVPLAEPTLSGNCLVIFLTYAQSNTRTLTITDNLGTTYPAVTIKTDDTTSLGATTAAYVVPNVSAGINLLTFTFDASLFYFHTIIVEAANIATVSPVDASSAAHTILAPYPQSGAITTTLDHDLILNYGIDVTSNIGGVATTTGIVSDSGFNLEAANRQLASFVQSKVWGTHGTINPSPLIVGTTDNYNSITLALKAAAAGTKPTGMYVAHAMHFRSAGAASPETFQFPSKGNLLVIGTSYTRTTNGTVGISSDSQSNTWTNATQGCPGSCNVNVPQMFYAANATTSPDLTITITASPLGAFQFMVFDIAGANTSPFDVRGDATGNQSVAGADIPDAPDITPTTGNGKVIGVTGYGIGPASGTVAPVRMLSCYFTGMTDGDLLDSGDAVAIIDVPSASTAYNFDWHMANTSVTSYFSSALAFKAPAGAVAAACSLGLSGVGPC